MKKNYILPVLVALIIAGGAFGGYKYLGWGKGASDLKGVPVSEENSNKDTKDAGLVSNNSAGNSAALSPDSKTSPGATSRGEGVPAESKYNLSLSFKSSFDQFAIKYPSGFSVKHDTVEDLQIYTIENGKGEGVQVSVSAFDEGGDSLTPTRIEDETGITVESAEDFTVAGKGKGISFVGDGTGLGHSREFWFVYRGRLYQVSAHLEYENLARAILATWQFN